MIVTNIEGLRDPFLLKENGVYYIYGTGVAHKDWNNTTYDCYINDSGRLDGEWKKTDNLIYVLPDCAKKQRWAPEVHKYNGKFYMFATYHSVLTEHKGCSVFRSEKPDGIFKEISNGHLTPPDIDAIDGTFYVDEEGTPWMVFVHEWFCADDGIGRMAAAKMSDDLTRFISEPIELFRADDPIWTNERVTDGCFMYKTADGQLLMIWSNFCESGYCVGIARSKNGKIDGEWTHDEKLLYSKELVSYGGGHDGGHDGGHGMIFKDDDGSMYLCIHTPNTPDDGEAEKTVIIPLREENGTLICDI